MVSAVFVVVISAPKLTLPVVLKPPAAVIFPVEFFVTVPLLVTATAPVAAKLLLSANAIPVSAAEPTDTVPLKVVVPVAALVCVKAPVMSTAPLNVIAALFVIVRAVRLVALPEPTAPRLTMPPAAFNVRLSAAPPAVPSVVPVMVSIPVPLVNVGVAASAIVKAPPMKSAELVVVILAAKLTSPEVLKPVGATIFPVELFVNVPLLVTATAPVVVKLLFTANVVPFSVAEPNCTVLLKVVAPVAAFVCVKAPVRFTAPLKVIAALLVTATVVRLVALPEPITPRLTTPPAAFKVKLSVAPPAVPSVVPVRVSVPEPLVNVGIAASAIVKAPPMKSAELVVVILAAKLTSPEVLKPAGATIFPVEFFVNVPLLVTETAPVAVKLLLTANAAPLKVAEPTDTAPVNVVVPVAAFVCVKAPVMFTAPLNVIAALFVIVRAVRLVALPEPTAPRLTMPPAAFKVRLSATPPAVPSVVPVMVSVPDPLVKVGDAASAIVKLPLMVSAAFVVEMLAAKFTSPEVLKPVGATIFPVAFFVNVPLLVTATAPVAVKLLSTANVVPFNVADPTATVLLKVVAPAAAFVCVKAPVRFTAPLNVIAALLVTVTAVRLVALPEPTAARLMIPPEAFKVKLSARPPAVPSVVPVMVSIPEPLVNVGVAASAIVKLPPMKSAELVVVMLAAKLTSPEVLKPVGATIFPVEFFVNVPLLVTATDPTAVKLLLTAKAAPFRLADPTATVLLNVVVPVAALVCVKAPVRFTAPLNVIAALFVTVTVVKLVELPDPNAARLTMPPAAFNVRVSATPPAVPSVVPARVRVPEPLVKVGVAASAIVKLPPMERAAFVVVILAAKFTAPEVLKPAGATILPVEFFVNVPLLVTEAAPVAVKLLSTANAAPLNVAEPTDTAPINVVVPVAALVWVRAPVTLRAASKFSAALFVIVNEEGTADPPTTPVKVIAPAVPPFTVSGTAPSTVLLNEIFAPADVPPVFVASNSDVAVKVTGPVIVMIPPLVVTFPPILIAVVPV